MENSLILKDYNGNMIPFELNNENIMINLTEMCKPFRKRPNDFLNLENTKKFIIKLEEINNVLTENAENIDTSIPGIEDNQIVKTVKGGDKQGTWVNRKLALKAAGWLSPEFEIWMMAQIEKLLVNGYVMNNNIKDEQLKKLQDEINQKDNLIQQKDTLILTKENQVTDLQKRVEKYKSNPKYEKTYQSWLHAIVGGDREVKVGTSVYKDKRKHKRIDILTDEYIFECKHVSQWEKALTQIQKYQLLMEDDNTYKNQKLIVFLFDNTDEYESEIDFIRRVAKKTNVSVFYYKNMAGYVDADELDDTNEF